MKLKIIAYIDTENKIQTKDTQSMKSEYEYYNTLFVILLLGKNLERIQYNTDTRQLKLLNPRRTYFAPCFIIYITLAIYVRFTIDYILYIINGCTYTTNTVTSVFGERYTTAF